MSAVTNKTGHIGPIYSECPWQSDADSAAAVRWIVSGLVMYNTLITNETHRSINSSGPVT